MATVKKGFNQIDFGFKKSFCVYYLLKFKKINFKIQNQHKQKNINIYK